MATELNFTKSAIEALPYPEQGRVSYKDSGARASVKGLVLRVGQQSKTFYLEKKVNGTKRRVRIATYPYPIEQARQRAQNLIAAFNDGIDPNQEKKAARAKGLSLQEVFSQYLDHASNRAKKPIRETTRRNYERSFAIHFSADTPKPKPNGKRYTKPARGWAGKAAKSLDSSMVESWYSKASKYSVSSANSAVRCLGAAYAHQIEISRKQQSGEFIYNPFAGIQMVEEKPRAGYLEPDQIATWLSAVDELQSPITRDYLKLVLFTGMRRREAASLRWDQIDIKRRIIRLDSVDTKNGKPIDIPMSDYMLELIGNRNKGNTTDFVFPGTGRSGHIEEPKKAVASVNDRAGTSVTVHDLRRSFSNLAIWQCEIPDAMRKALMNHAPDKNDVTARHYTALPIDQKRKYQQRITDKLLELGGIDWTDKKVVQLEAVK